MDKNTNIAVLICVAFTFLALTQAEQLGNQVDYRNIWSCARDGFFVDSYEGACNNYPPLLIWIAKIFSTREIFYKQALTILVFLITPLIIFRITRNWVTVWFYFTATNFAYATITSMFIANHLVVLFSFLMFTVKDRWRVVLLLLSIITHSTGIWIGIGTYFLIKLQDTWFEKKKFEPLAFLQCSPIWGKEIPGALSQKIISADALQAGYITPNILLSLVIKRLPIPYLILGVKGLIDTRSIALLVLFVGYLFSGLFIHERALYFMAIPMIIGLTYTFEKLEFKWKALLLGSTVIYLIFHIQQALEILKCPG